MVDGSGKLVFYGDGGEGRETFICDTGGLRSN
jgi:hypothetical protein